MSHEGGLSPSFEILEGRRGKAVASLVYSPQHLHTSLPTLLQRFVNLQKRTVDRCTFPQYTLQTLGSDGHSRVDFNDTKGN